MTRGDWRNPLPVPPVEKMIASEVARERHENREGFIACGLIILALADRRVPDRISDLHAEQRALGWLLCRRSKASEFIGLEPYDFAAEPHRFIYTLGFDLLEAHERGEVPASLRPSRDVVWRAAESGSPEHHVAVADALRVLPWPAVCPDLEIALVGALGRRWSLVEEEFG